MKKYLFIALVLISFGAKAEWKELKSGKKVYLIESKKDIVIMKVVDSIYMNFRAPSGTIIEEKFVSIKVKNEKGKTFETLGAVWEDGTGFIIQDEKFKSFIVFSKEVTIYFQDYDKKEKSLSFSTNGLDFMRVK